MTFEFTEMEAMVLEKAVKLVLEYDRDGLAEEAADDQKLMWQAEIDDLTRILKILRKKLG